MNRICMLCKIDRRTTNKESPYLCEICLRTKGRDKLIFKDTKDVTWRMVIGVGMLVIGIIIGLTV